MLKKFNTYPGRKNLCDRKRAAFQDKIENGKVHDEKRVDYLKQYIQAVLKAKNEGVNVKGYFVWTFTDNFEWAEGFYPRFGLVYVDLKTQQRTVKSSGIWYKEFLES